MVPHASQLRRLRVSPPPAPLSPSTSIAHTSAMRFMLRTAAVDFRGYQIVCIVAAKDAAIPLSPAFDEYPGTGVTADGIEGPSCGHLRRRHTDASCQLRLVRPGAGDRSPSRPARLVRVLSAKPQREDQARRRLGHHELQHAGRRLPRVATAQAWMAGSRSGSLFPQRCPSKRKP